MENLKPILGKRDKPEEENTKKCELYTFTDGLRFVKPYTHDFTCFAKRRWIGSLLIDIYS